MNIAIDVHSLGSRASGNETYFQQLVRGLVLDKSHNRYALFYMHDGAPESNPTDARFRWVRIPRNPLWRLGLSLPRALREIQPDVFHCQYIQPLFVRCKTVVTIHDLAYEHLSGFAHPLEVAVMRKLVRATARRADRILTVSQFSAEDIVRTYRVPAEKVRVAYQAASEEFHPRNKEDAQAYLAKTYGIAPPFLLYVGRIQARKNLERLVDAYAALLQNHPAIKLVMAGKPDWGFEDLRNKIAALRLGDRVVLPGYVPAGDLPLFYNAAELFIFPSLFEGFGLPVLESMASGVATVTSRGSSLEEVAGDGALLIDPHKVDSMTEAMDHVLTNEACRRNLIARGLVRSSEFSAQSFAEQVLQVYQSLG
ncbi:MAG TPA: glycosyltransferase family 1 protein [Verrucomicrobiae bacterium]|nr:glycosyltransferase family 1 protein [Verrucomicrobiae bacterium]